MEKSDHGRPDHSEPTALVLARVFESAGRDAEADEVEEQLEDIVLASDLDGTILLELECRKQLCRAELEHVDQEALDDFLSLASVTPPWDTEGYLELLNPGAEGRLRASIYVARRGHYLP